MEAGFGSFPTGNAPVSAIGHGTAIIAKEQGFDKYLSINVPGENSVANSHFESDLYPRLMYF